jgi:hypothetical protein
MMPNEIRHQKNAAEWIMWIALLPLFGLLWMVKTCFHRRGAEGAEAFSTDERASAPSAPLR